jgi:hypothetical protein
MRFHSSILSLPLNPSQVEPPAAAAAAPGADSAVSAAFVPDATSSAASNASLLAALLGSINPEQLSSLLAQAVATNAAKSKSTNEVHPSPVSERTRSEERMGRAIISSS